MDTTPSDLSRIVIDPDICGGRPTIAGTRVRVNDVLDMLADGVDRQTILADFPYLADEDISAAIRYAAAFLNHRVVQAA